MALVLHIPTWATFNKIPAEAPPGGLAAINAATGTPISVGDPNPVWSDLQDISLGGGWFLRPHAMGEIARSSPIENTSFLEPRQAQLAVAVGGEVTGMDVYFELDNLDEEVPASFANRTYLVPGGGEPQEVVHTWATWGCEGGNHAPVQIGDKWYKSSSDARDLGRPIPASQWAFAGLTVKTVAEFVALRPGV